ncbi:hypothetical protein OIU83_23390 [Flavobacterium sp. LS1R49]|uniref:G8 domain-containing protein n=1 Tax=Flavobacterium shii TaxID=2987687 RepID=A0A9X2ZMV9_9FLAO|nr:hypothetical protein [Flavobacterium shii]MCV9930623.1 hypothetical protein [Flavobacterium shii]
MNRNILIIVVLLLFNFGYGQNNWTGAASTDWEDNSNWSSGHTPLATESVIISNVPNQPVISVAGAVCSQIVMSNSTPGSTVSLTVTGAGIFTVGAITMDDTGNDSVICSLKIGTGTVNVSGSVFMNGSANRNNISFTGAGTLNIGFSIYGGALSAGTGLVNYNSTTQQQNIASFTYYNLTISGSTSKLVNTAGVIVNGVFSMEGTATVSAAPTYGSAAALEYYTTTPRTAGPEWVTPFTATRGVIISNTGAITTDSNKAMSDNVPLTINNGATLLTGTDIGTGFNYNLYFRGDFINNGILISYGDVFIEGTASIQSIGGFTIEGGAGVHMRKTIGTATLKNNIAAGFLRINGIGGTLNLGTGLTHTFTETLGWIRTNGTLDGGSSLLKIGGDISGSGGSFIAGTGTVEFNGVNQNLGTGAITYNNLTFSGSGVKTISPGTVTVNGTLSIEGDSIMSISTAPIYGATATLQYNSAVAHTVGAE